MWQAEIGSVDGNGPAGLRVRWLPERKRFLVTSELGDWELLEPSELRALAEGTAGQDAGLEARLLAARLVHGEMSLEGAVRSLRRRWAPLFGGPERHVLWLARASDEEEAPPSLMDPDVGEACVAAAFESTSRGLVIELAGEDPLHAWRTIQHIAGRARARARLEGREVRIVLRSDLKGLNEDYLAWLVEAGVGIRALFDDEGLGDPRSTACWWVTRFHRAWAEAGLDPEVHHADLVIRPTPATLEHPERVVKAAGRLKARTVTLEREPAWGHLGGEAPYPIEAWIRFRAAVIEGLLDRSAKPRGVRLLERQAASLVRRMLGRLDPLRGAPRSPAAAGIGELAYDVDGSVYASSGGLELALAGEDLLRLGSVYGDSYHLWMQRPLVRTLVAASITYSQPGCSSCAYLPWCGQDPARNVGDQGSIHGRMGEADHCREMMALFDQLVALLAGEGEASRAEVLRGWAEAPVPAC